MQDTRLFFIRSTALVLVAATAVGALLYGASGKPDAVASSQNPISTAPLNQPTSATQVTPQPDSNQSAPPASETASVYKDGTYSAVGSYISPGGDEKIAVTVTLADDVITAASVTPEPVSDEGAHFQGIFASRFEPLVVGKNIADVHLSEVSGSSLTSGGFNQALAEIESEAQA